MKYSMNLMTANPFSPSPGTTATAQFQKQPLLQTSLSELLICRSIPQGSSFLATLGWMMESLQDSENARHRLDDSNRLGLV